MIDSKSKVGFVFEVGFNVGAMSVVIDKIEGDKKFTELLETLKKSSNRLDMYNCILDSENIDECLKDNIDTYMFKGYFNGKGFMREYFNSFKQKEVIKIEYIQANFDGKDFGERNDYEVYNNKINLKQQLGVDLQDFEIQEFLYKGEFLNADSIFLFSEYGEYHLIVVDNAISIKNLIDINEYTDVKKSYIKNIINKKTRSSFSDLGIDSDCLDIDINSKVCDYILGLNNDNKPLYKMVQAGSYAYSFINFLKCYRKDIYSKLKRVSIYGYTDTEVSSMNLTKESFLIEKEDSNIIKDNKSLLKNLDNELARLSSGYILSDRCNIKSTLADKKKSVFLGIQKGFKDKFKDVDMQYLTDIKYSKDLIEDNVKVIEDRMEGFQNTSGTYNDMQSFRDKHADLITEQLKDKNTQIICLTENPGIGKTTAIVNALKEEESFLFVYVSPRTQVNKDIEEKFLLDENKGRELYSKEAVYLTADSNDEVLKNGREIEVVNYNSQNKAFDADKYNVKFLDINRDREQREDIKGKYISRDSRSISKVENISSGVLKRLTKGIKDAIDYNLSNKIISTVSMQSLKSVGNKRTTMHINKIFEDIYNEKTKLLNIEGYKKLASKIKNIVIMIDEITGDESGAVFLNDIIKTLLKNIKDKLPNDLKDLINIKIVVADASITSVDVIKKHLENSNVDSDKFYFKKVKEESKSISSEKFKFRNKYNAVSINTNSFPATYIDFKYNIINETKIVNENLVKGDGYNALNAIDSKILERVLEFIKNEDNKDRQIIVYIQNIKRLQEVKHELEKFYRNIGINEKDKILEINSTLTDVERQNIFVKKESAKVVLMTSSAARGISFKRATTILVDVPDFDLPKNIMEILQLIYRGRGDIYIDTHNSANIEFYIKNSIYLRDGKELKVCVREKLFKVMTLIMIIKMSIETRIYGLSELKQEKFMLVPIGGKAISSVSKLDIDEISGLIKSLNKEISKGQQELRSVRRDLISYFSNINYKLTEEILKRENIKDAKFNISNINSKFMQQWDKSIICNI